VARTAAAARRSATRAEAASVDARAREAAGRIRRFIASAFAAGPAPSLVLAPGVLAALRLFLGARGVRRIVMSDVEYYGPAHFPEFDVHVAMLDAIVDECTRTRADAVIVSTVSYRGMYVPVNEIARRLRDSLGDRAPLVVADATQNGAAGFPRIDRLGADICCGDASKWVTPFSVDDRLAYLWFASASLRDEAQRVFGAFFQATATPRGRCAARWLTPEHLAELDEAIRRRRITRSSLKAKHAANLALASSLASSLGLEPPPTAILWVPGEASLPAWARPLSWAFPGLGTRVLCYADARQAGHR
jgi:hypothetical protein